MSSYTMELREIIEHYSQYDNGLTHNERIEIGRQNLFDFDYPFFMESRRQEFETHFIRHFYMREIGFETEGLFKFYLETWLLINMPYFNKLFQSELLVFDPFISYDLLTTYERDLNKNEQGSKDTTHNATTLQEVDSLMQTNGSSTRIAENDSTQDSTNTNTATRSQVTDSSQTDVARTFERDIESNTPDNRLELVATDGVGVIEYADKITEKVNTNNTTNDIDVTVTNDDVVVDVGNIVTNDKNTTTDNLESDQSTGTTDNKTTNVTSNDELTNNESQLEKYNEHKIGSIGVKTYSAMLDEYRATFLRIERDCFREMTQLFMLVY